MTRMESTSMMVFFLLMSLVLMMAPLPTSAAIDLSESKKSLENDLAKDFATLGLSTASPPTGRLPYSRGKGYPQLFTRKTSTLLAEALQMLHRAKDVKERRWLEAYIHRLGVLAADLERSTTDGASLAKGVNGGSIISKILKQTLKQSKTVNSNPEILVGGEPERIYVAGRSGPKSILVSSTVAPEFEQPSKTDEKDQTSGRTVAADAEDDLVLQLRRQPMIETSATTREIRSQPDSTVVTKMIPHTEPLAQTLSVTETPSLTSPVSPDLTSTRSTEDRYKKLHTVIKDIITKMHEYGVPEDEVVNILKDEIRKEVEAPVIRAEPSKRDDDDDFSEEGAAIGDIESSEQQLSNDQAGTVTPSRVVDRMAEEIPVPKIATEPDLALSTPGLDAVQRAHQESGVVSPTNENISAQDDDLVKQLQEEKFLLIPTDTSSNFMSEEVDLVSKLKEELMENVQSETSAPGQKDQVKSSSNLPSSTPEDDVKTSVDKTSRKSSSVEDDDSVTPHEVQTIDRVVKRLKESIAQKDGIKANQKSI